MNGRREWTASRWTGEQPTPPAEQISQLWKQTEVSEAVFRIRDMLVRIRILILGSVPTKLKTCVPEAAVFRIRKFLGHQDPDPDS